MYHTTRRARSVEIPHGAITVDLPDLQQPNNYSCGFCLMSVAKYAGLGPNRFSTYKRKMKTKKSSGTYYRDIEAYANELGLDASVEQGMTKRRLKALLNLRIPVILSLQAYARNPASYDNPNHNDDGHYVVAIGYANGCKAKRGPRLKRFTDDCFYFMDPSLICRRGFLFWKELDKRWHENEGVTGNELSHHLGIVVGLNGHKPVYDRQALWIP